MYLKNEINPNHESFGERSENNDDDDNDDTNEDDSGRKISTSALVTIKL